MAILNQEVKVVGNVEIAKNTNWIDLDWPDNYPEPGQFIKLMTKDNRQFPFMRPFSIADCEYGAISLLIREAGENTAFYRDLKKRDMIEAIGPFGKPFDLKLLTGVKECLFVAGGFGVAPLLYLIRWITEKCKTDPSRSSLKLFYGEREMEYLMNLTTFPFWSFLDQETVIQRCVESIPHDIGKIRKGKVTDLLQEKLRDGKNLGRLIISCGPIPMLREVSRIAEKNNIDCWVSMEAMMGCGWGACKSCGIFQKDGSVLNVCTDGPFMLGREIDWSQFDRKKVFIKRKKVVEFDPKKDMFSTTLIGQKNLTLPLEYPFINASKGLGIEEVESGIVDLTYFGAFETEGITLHKRSGNIGPRLAEIFGGALNSIGLQNEGVDYNSENKLPRWNAFGKPVWVNISGNSPEEFVECVRKLPKVGVAAVVLNISCPNNKSADKIFALYEELASEVVDKCKKERPDLFLIAKLSPRARDNVVMGQVCVQAGADALSFENTMPGADIDPFTGIMKTRGKNGIAGISGIPLQNILFRDLIELDQAQLGMPLIAIGGIYTWQTALKAFRCGANAIQACTALYSNTHWATDLHDGLEKFMLENNIKHIQHLVGERIL